MKYIFTLCVMFLFAQTLPKSALSQQAPIYKFESGVLESGTSNATGALYRFTSSYTGIDALVSIEGMSTGISLQNIDRTADGYSEAFQPEYRISANTNAYIDFKIRFVTTGTNTSVSQPIVSASGLDIDGSSKNSAYLKEFNRIDMGGGTYEFNSYNSQVVVSQTGTAFTGANITGILFGALVDTAAKEVMFTVTSTSVSSMTFRVGANNQTSSAATRYASLYFKKFEYQHYPLAISNLLSFDGFAKDNNATLQWEMMANEYSKIVLERSSSSSDFNKISEYTLVADDDNRKVFSYTDYNIPESVVYYRLKATTKSGHIEYSNILSLHFAKKITTLNVYPSVIKSTATVNIISKEAVKATLFISDLSGRIVKQQTLILNAAINNIRIDGLDKFSKGNYIISLRTGTDLFTRKVIVQ